MTFNIGNKSSFASNVLLRDHDAIMSTESPIFNAVYSGDTLKTNHELIASATFILLFSKGSSFVDHQLSSREIISPPF